MPNTTVKKWLTGLAIVVLVLGLAEIAVSSYAEKMLANVLLANARIRTRPDVAFKSFPNIAKLPTGHSGDLLINLNDEPDASPDIPRANVQVEYNNQKFNQQAL